MPDALQSMWLDAARSDSVRLRSPHLQSSYLEWLVPARVVRLRLLMRAALVGAFATAPLDYLLFGLAGPFGALIAVRAIAIGCTLWALNEISDRSCPPTPSGLDQLEATWAAVVLVCILATDATRPTIGHVGMDALVVVAIYLCSRPPLHKHVLAATFCAIDVGLAAARGLPATDLISLTGPLVAACFIGHFLGSAIDVFLRQRFFDSLDLHTTKAEETIPMCAYCDSIRYPEEGTTWLRPKEYLAAHAPIRVTHGICDGCGASALRTGRAPRAGGLAGDGARIA